MATLIAIKKPASIPFTLKAYEKMKADAVKLEKGRGAILVRLQTAREMGDLSENGAYKAAKFELRTTDRELRRLGYLIKYGRVTKSKHEGTIDFGSKATIELNDKKHTFMMVSVHESDPKKHKLSVESPIGKAIMGKKVGDKVTVSAPAGEVTYTVVDIE